MAQTHNSYPVQTAKIPEQSAVEKAQLAARLSHAVLEGNRPEAAKLQGELRELKPVTFPEDVQPKVWNSGQVKELGSPLHQLDGNHADFMRDQLQGLAEKPGNPKTTDIAHHFLRLAGVQKEGAKSIELPKRYRQGDQETALDAYAAQKLVDQVGTFTEASGGVSYRTPDGHLNSFRLPEDEVKADRLVTSLQEAGYQQTNGLPVVITNNPAQNQAAFDATQRY